MASLGINKLIGLHNVTVCLDSSVFCSTWLIRFLLCLPDPIPEPNTDKGVGCEPLRSHVSCLRRQIQVQAELGTPCDEEARCTKDLQMCCLWAVICFAERFVISSETFWPYQAFGKPGPRLNIKTVLSMYGDFHVKDKTAVRASYL